MSVAIKYATDVTWGTESAGTSTAGIILSANRKSTAKQFEQVDENGELHSLILHDHREEVTLEVLAKAVRSDPAVGSTITVDGVADIIVTEVDIAWRAGDTVKYNITGWKSVA